MEASKKEWPSPCAKLVTHWAGRFASSPGPLLRAWQPACRLTALCPSPPVDALPCPGHVRANSKRMEYTQSARNAFSRHTRARVRALSLCCPQGGGRLAVRQAHFVLLPPPSFPPCCRLYPACTHTHTQGRCRSAPHSTAATDCRHVRWVGAWRLLLLLLLLTARTLSVCGRTAGAARDWGPWPVRHQAGSPRAERGGAGSR